MGFGGDLVMIFHGIFHGDWMRSKVISWDILGYVRKDWDMYGYIGINIYIYYYYIIIVIVIIIYIGTILFTQGPMLLVLLIHECVYLI